MIHTPARNTPRSRPTPTRPDWGTRWLSLRLLLAGLLGLIAASTAWAERSHHAHLVPAEAGVYLELNRPAALAEDWGDDPLLKRLLSRGPIGRHPGAWVGLQRALGLDGPQILRRYFGRTLILTSARPGQRSTGVLMTQVDPSELDRLRGRRGALGLEAQPASYDFERYRTFDGGALVAMGRGWLVMTSGGNATYLERVLQTMAGSGTSLADDPQFARWRRRLPGEATERRDVRAFIRRMSPPKRFAAQADAGEDGWAIHTLAGRFESRRLILDYAGRHARVTFERMGQADALRCPLVPSEAMLSLSLNSHQAQVVSRLPLLRRLFRPASLEQDVLPRLEAPVVLMVGAVPAEGLSPDLPKQGVTLAPAAGLALKLRDPAVAKLLGGALDRLFTRSDRRGRFLRDLPPIDRGRGQLGPAVYHWAKIGPRLAQRLGRPNLQGATVAYGRVGDWFLLTSSEPFLRRCIRAAQADRAEEGPAMPARQADADVSLPGRPLLDLRLNAQGVDAVLDAWVAYWSRDIPGFARGGEPDWRPAQRRLAKALLASSHLAGAYRGLSLKLHRSEEDALVGRLELIRAGSADVHSD